MATLLEKLEFGIPSEQNIQRAVMMTRGVCIQETIHEIDETKLESQDDMEQSSNYESSEPSESLNGEEVIEDELWMFLRSNATKFDNNITNVYHKLIENDLSFDELLNFSKTDLTEILKEIGLNETETSSLLSLIWDNEKSVVYQNNSKEGVVVVVLTKEEHHVLLELQQKNAHSTQNIQNLKNAQNDLNKSFAENESVINEQFKQLFANLENERKKLLNENNGQFTELNCKINKEIVKFEKYESDLDYVNQIMNNKELKVPTRKKEILSRMIGNNNDNNSKACTPFAIDKPLLEHLEIDSSLCDLLNETMSQIGDFHLMQKNAKERRKFEMLFEDYKLRISESPKVEIEKCKANGCDLIITTDISSLNDNDNVNAYDMIEHKIEYRLDECEGSDNIKEKVETKWSSRGRPIKLKLKNDAKKKSNLGACKVSVSSLCEFRNYEIRCCSCLWSSKFENTNVQKKWSKYSFLKMKTTYVRDAWDVKCIGAGMQLKGDCLGHPSESISNSAFFTKEICEGIHHWKFEIKKCARNDSWKWTIGLWRILDERLEPPTETYFTKRRFDGYGFMCNVGQLVNIGNSKKSKIVYGTICKTNDIVDMYCDMNKLTLSFGVNGKHYGKAYDIQKGVYKASVNLCKQYDQVLFMQYQRK